MLNWFKKTECLHEKITPDLKAAYCPDCGLYVENHWYVSRCLCCGIKHNTKIVKGKISPVQRYCKNCGSDSFVVEKINNLNIVDVNYAIVLKHVEKTQAKPYTQVWVDEESRYFSPKLLTGV